MVFFGVLIGIFIMGAMIYLALDKKSTFKLRLASLGAIALMLITVIICIIVVVTDDTVPMDPSVLNLDELDKKVVKEDDGSSTIIIIFSILFFLALFIVIIFLAMKEHKKQDKK